jgi:hypothetical protein
MTVFFKTKSGSLLNSADVVKIEAGEIDKEDRALVTLRNGEQHTLAYSIADAEDLLAELIPAAPGFFVYSCGSTERDCYAVVAWRRRNWGIDPVTTSSELNSDESILGGELGELRCLRQPDGTVMDHQNSIHRNVDDWWKWQTKLMQEKHKLASA